MATFHESETIANALMERLVGTQNATLPDIDLYADPFSIPWDENSAVFKEVAPVTEADLTSRQVGGTGVFDAMMDAFRAHLQKEFDEGRITGADYTKVYLGLTQTAMQAAVQFVLGRDQASWMAMRAQADAVTARTQNEVAKLQAMLARANFALTKLKLATEDSAYGQSERQISDILPRQAALLAEQGNAQRAQTADTRSPAPISDGEAVTGVMAAQKGLYTQQISSYKADERLKATKVFTDAWTARKTLDDGVLVPDLFCKASTDGVLEKLRQEAIGLTEEGLDDFAGQGATDSSGA